MSETPTAADNSVFPDTFAASLAALDQQAQRLRAMQAAEMQRSGQLPVAAAAAAAGTLPAAAGGPRAQLAEAADTSDGSLSDAEGSSGSPRSGADAEQAAKRSSLAASGMPLVTQPHDSNNDELAGHKRTADVLQQDVVLDESGQAHQLSPKEYRRLRRRITNRESAHRMRAKRQEELGTVQREAAALGQENAQLKSHIGRLEREQRSLALDLVSWQTRWKTTAASNVKLYHQLINLQHRQSEQQQHYVNLPSPPPAVHRMSTAPSAPPSVLQQLNALGSTPDLARSASDCSSIKHPQLDGGAGMHPAAGFNYDVRAPAYADQLNAALSTIFGARDAALEPNDVLGSGDMPSPHVHSNLSGVRRWC